MRILKTIVYIYISLLVTGSCSPQAPLTVEDAFIVLQRSYRSEDAVLLNSVLSEKSRNRLSRMADYFSSMDNEQMNRLERYYRVKPGGLKNLTLEKVIRIACFNKSDPFYKAVSAHRIVKIDKKEDSAVVQISNGMKLPFVKQGPYWKFDLTGF